MSSISKLATRALPFCKGDCDLYQWQDGREHAIIRFDLQAGPKEHNDLHTCSGTLSERKTALDINSLVGKRRVD